MKTSSGEGLSKAIEKEMELQVAQQQNRRMMRNLLINSDAHKSHDLLSDNIVGSKFYPPPRLDEDSALAKSNTNIETTSMQSQQTLPPFFPVSPSIQSFSPQVYMQNQQSKLLVPLNPIQEHILDDTDMFIKDIHDNRTEEDERNSIVEVEKKD